MLTVDELAHAFHALSPSNKKAFRKKITPRKPPLSRELVHEATRAVMMELTTIDDNPFDQWLMNLTLEEVKALKRTSNEGKYIFVPHPIENWSDKMELSLDIWKQTTEGYEVFKREGQEGFEAWATCQTEKLKTFKGLSMEKLLNLVEERIGLTRTRKKRKEKDRALPPKGGKFRTYVQEAKDDFLILWYIHWHQIPSPLRDGRQPGMRGGIDAYSKRLDDLHSR